MIKHAPPYPALILESGSKRRFGLIGDLHLGLEASFLRSSPFFSTFFSEEIIDGVKTFIQKNSINNLIFLGDLKHTFWTLSLEETRLIKSFLSVLEEEDVNMYMIMGNHDSKIEDLIAEHMNINLYKEAWLEVPLAEEEKVVVMHGHRKIPRDTLSSATHIIQGHIHPCIRISGMEASNIRVFIEFEATLGEEGEIDFKKVMVMPAFNSLACYRFMPEDLKAKLVNLKNLEFKEEDLLAFDLNGNPIGNLGYSQN